MILIFDDFIPILFAINKDKFRYNLGLEMKFLFLDLTLYHSKDSKRIKIYRCSKTGKNVVIVNERSIEEVLGT